MTGRDHWTESLDCPKCRKTGIVKLSQANGRAFHEGDQDILVDLLPIGFKVVLTEFGSSFYCAACGTSVDHKMTDKPLKRPRDPAQLAKLMIDIASGEKPDPPKEEKRPTKGASKSKASVRSPAAAKKA